MAPQIEVTNAQSSTPDANAKLFVPVPVALSIFLGCCAAYALSYVLYRVIMARRSESKDDVPDTPDRGVSQFMNGGRLTLNLPPTSTTTTIASKSLLNDTRDEVKPLSDPFHPSHLDIPASSSAGSSASPFINMTPSFTMHPNQEISQVQLPEKDPLEDQTPISTSDPIPGLTQQPLSQRVAAKVKFVSRDRAEAIALDPKLAPVQGPIRPLSMVASPSPKKRTLFGFRFKRERRHDANSEQR